MTVKCFFKFEDARNGMCRLIVASSLGHAKKLMRASYWLLGHDDDAFDEAATAGVLTYKVLSHKQAAKKLGLVSDDSLGDWFSCKW